MTDLATRYAEHLRWLAEYGLVPVHLLAMAHMYEAAIVTAGAVLVAHLTAAICCRHGHNPVRA